MMLASFLVFIFLNLIENVIQYSIGRTTNEKKIEWKSPTGKDWARIIIVMMIFAVFQAFCSFGLDVIFENFFTRQKNV